MRMFRMVATVALAATATVAMAMPTFMTDVYKTYKVKPGGIVAKAACSLCHADAKNHKILNPYGNDLKAAMAKAGVKTVNAAVLKAVDGLDSNKDGVKNGASLGADKLPGTK